jgi:hypothetical protein
MKSHEFRLVLAGISDVSMDDADARFEAGCGDELAAVTEA